MLKTQSRNAAARDYRTTFTVAQAPVDVYNAIVNVRGWWSEEIEGATDTVGQSFDYHFQDIHRAKIHVDELLPGRRVTWTVTKNYFSFTADQSEWTGTRIVFDITDTPAGTDVAFTHIGLVPDYECFDACSDGWRTYIAGSLKSLIETGAGNPNKGEALTGSEAALGKREGHVVEITTTASPDRVFAALLDPQSWWDGDYSGDTKAKGDRFTYSFKTFHRTTQELTEVVPDRRLVWEVVASHIAFVEDKDEWTGTRIVFDIAPFVEGSRLTFTHEGLNPAFECFGGCSGAWDGIIGDDLKALLDA